MKNFSLKAWSLIIAVSLAYFVNSLSNSTVISLIVPVELRNLPESKVVLLPSVRQAQVTIRGPSHLMEGVGQSPPSFSVSIPREVGDHYSFNLQSENLVLPPGVEVLNIDPPEMELVLDDLVTRKVPVQVPRIGVLRDDFVLDKMLITPHEVTVTGPASEMDSLKSVETAAIDVRSIQETVSRTLILSTPGRYVKLEPPKVSVEVVVRQLESEKKFNKIPLEVRHSGDEDRYISSLQFVSIEVSGPRGKMSKLKSSLITCFVEVSEEEARSSFEAQIHVELPDEIKLVFINPETVTLTALPKAAPASK
ncbi:MAG: YbbR-like domain-containing protein [Bdellovibrionales bacterium]|nr:YbbR-like domain-containing protein [Bdellovibrionales bacterium]